MIYLDVLCGLLYNFSLGSSCPLVLDIIQNPRANSSVEGCPLCSLKEVCDPGGGCVNVKAAGQEAGQRQRCSLFPFLPPSLPSVKAQLHLVGTCPAFFLTTAPALATSVCPHLPPSDNSVWVVKVQFTDSPYVF